MFRKNKKNRTLVKSSLTKNLLPSVIASDLNLLGNIISEGDIEFDGKINGNIQCRSLVVRANGEVHGEIRAENIMIYGRIKGMVQASQVALFSGAIVEGIILHDAISIEDGAEVDGKVKRRSSGENISSLDLPIEDTYFPATEGGQEKLRLINDN